MSTTTADTPNSNSNEKHSPTATTNRSSNEEKALSSTEEETLNLKIVEKTEKEATTTHQTETGLNRNPEANFDNLARDVFALNKHDAYWLKMYAKLREYKEMHGDTYVPKSYPKDQPLANWVQEQRKQVSI